MNRFSIPIILVLLCIIFTAIKQYPLAVVSLILVIFTSLDWKGRARILKV